MTAFTDYLAEVSRTLARGDATEHTYRPALKHFIETVNPSVVATNEPRREVCGSPDFIVTNRGNTPIGYIEAKDIGERLQRIERSAQLKRYRESLDNLILTDYLAFRWYVNGELRLTATLGEADGIGAITRNPAGPAELEHLLSAFFASRVAIVANPQELAQRLAGLARLTRHTLAAAVTEEQREGPLREQLEGFRAVLLPDLTTDRFADIYAQTIVYGLFAARCNAPGDRPFTRQSALFDLPRTNPFLRRLFNYLAGPDLDDRLDWLVDDVADLLDRTNVGAVLEGFGRPTRRQDPVFHFYETFLASYDSQMREARGVYYTPEPVVSYIVASVEHLLRDIFGLREGLAHASRLPHPSGDAEPEHRLLILDPAVGTGTFLHEVIALIETHVKQTMGDGAWGGSNGYVAQHLLPRVFGFELLMAPYTVAHMKVGLQLHDSGYDFDSDRRLGIYLTNTLESGDVGGDQYQFVSWLRDEATEAAAIKRDRPVMVVLGNPPYSGHSANKGLWINVLLQGLDTTESPNGQPTHSYFHIDGVRIKERNPKWLRDDYVKFIRFAQWRIDRTGSGILAFITNHGYLNNPTFRAMRHALMETFDDIYVLDLHGNSKKKERSPDGTLDQNVFDIQQGVAIGIFVKRGPRAAEGVSRVVHADLWGVRETWQEESDNGRRLTGGKYHFLGSNNVATTAWTRLSPSAPFFSFVPRDPRVDAEWRRGFRLPDIMPINVLGFQTHRDHFAIDLEREVIRARIAALRSRDLSDEMLRQRYRLKDGIGWSLASARSHLRTDADWEQKIVQCVYRPFDIRWCYFSDHIMDRPRRELLDHVSQRDNLCILSSRQQGTAGYRHSWVSRLPANDCVVSTRSREANQVFPIYRYPTRRDLLGEDLGEGVDGRRPNFEPAFLRAISDAWGWRMLAGGRGDLASSISPEDVAAYIYALLSAPPYRERYAEPLREDFPRIFLCPSPDLARQFIEIGHELTRLHLLEGEIPSSCRLMGEGSRLVDYARFVAARDQAEEDVGRITINGFQAFEPVLRDVWELEVGGFQVCQKWLGDRRGRHLSADDVETYRRIVGSLAATLDLMERLEELIDDTGGLPFARLT